MTLKELVNEIVSGQIRARKYQLRTEIENIIESANADRISGSQLEDMVEDQLDDELAEEIIEALVGDEVENFDFRDYIQDNFDINQFVKEAITELVGKIDYSSIEIGKLDE